MNVLVTVVSSQYNETEFRMSFSDCPDRLHAAHGWKAQVHQHNVCATLRADSASLFSRPHLADYNHIRLQTDDCRQAKTHDWMIVDQDDSNRFLRHPML